MTFYDGSENPVNQIGSPESVSNGSATISTASLLTGMTHTITAVYSGDSLNFIRSMGTLDFVVVATATTTTVTASIMSPHPVFGQAVTFTATIAPSGSGTGTPNGGDVTFYADTQNPANQIGQPTAVSNGVAISAAMANLAVGIHTIIACYSGDDVDFAGSPGNLNDYQVDRANTTIQVTGPANGTVFGQAASFTATVLAQAPGAGTVASGNVTFYADTQDTAHQIGLPVVLAGINTATISTSTLAVLSNHTIIAVYSGNANFNYRTGQLSPYPVAKASTQATVTAAPAANTVFGQAVTFTATITAMTPSLASPPTGGTVTFFDYGTQLGTPQNLLAGGVVRLVVPSGLAVGAHTIYADYSGDGTNYLDCSGSLTPYPVAKARTSTTVNGSPGSTVFGQLVVLSATITAPAPGGGPPNSGSVTFYDGAAIPANQIGAPVSVNSGVATKPTTSLAVGSHTITAVYSGSAQHIGSSNTLAFTVVAADTSTVVTASIMPPSYPVFGQTVNFTAVISPTGGGSGTVNSGTVKFYKESRSPANQIGQPVSVNNGAAVSLPVTGLAVGIHTIIADYSGDGIDFAASSGTLVNYTVVKANTAAQVSGPAGGTVYGQAATFTAAVSVQAQVPAP